MDSLLLLVVALIIAAAVALGWYLGGRQAAGLRKERDERLDDFRRVVAELAAAEERAKQVPSLQASSKTSGANAALRRRNVRGFLLPRRSGKKRMKFASRNSAPHAKLFRRSSAKLAASCLVKLRGTSSSAPMRASTRPGRSTRRNSRRCFSR